MSNHHISNDGTTIVCTAPEDAGCRTRPLCDAETWTAGTCDGHTPAHDCITGQSCWQTEWLQCDLEDTYDELAEAFDVRPGAPVELDWQQDYMLWSYEGSD